MKLFRNPEIKCEFLFLLGLSIVVTLLAAIIDPRFVLFSASLCLFFLAAHFCISIMRYRRIEKLSEAVNRILHGDTAVGLESYTEGELSILQSELSKMTVRLQDSEAQLKQDKRALADSLADISHQIRTPLTSINLLVSMLGEEALSEARRLTLCRELSALLSQIDRLITTLLKLSKLDAGTVQMRRTTLSLESLLRKASAPLLIPMELHSQQLSITASGNVLCDPEWTQEAIGNIIKNCMEHTPENGLIEIQANETALYSEIIIRDNGTGIAPEDLPHIFERFYKGKHSDKTSFGIGLSFARTVITAQNGSIKAENLCPNGAVFTVHLYKGTV
ncbi:MAG: HAMP domain-containing histidine kinase [Clostridia bacterium]|nr:HAMP domain-containing histidine kinase [Clostridia bacterium]